MELTIYNHIALGEVQLEFRFIFAKVAWCTTIADNIMYRIYLIDLIDY